MLTIAVLLNGLCALGLFAMAGKYLTGPVPADYHATILEAGGHAPDDSLRTVVGALYKVMGSAMAAVAVGIVAVSVFGVWSGHFWAKATVLGMVLVVGVPSTLTAWRVARENRVKAPWIPAAALSLLGTIAFVISLM